MLAAMVLQQFLAGNVLSRALKSLFNALVFATSSRCSSWNANHSNLLADFGL
jgi:hypothetical protein